MTSPSNPDPVLSALASNRQTLMEKQAGRRYPALFSAMPKRDRSRNSWQRPGTGIIVRMILHEELTAEQLDAIGEYRLDQYILAGLYDDERAAELGLTSDPNLVDLPGSTVHLLVGDAWHRLLCYASFEPAHIPATIDMVDTKGSDPAGRSAAVPSRYRMCDTHRPLFSVEFAFGPKVYASHPEIAQLPTAAVREMMRMIRNQAIRAPLTSITTVEVIAAASHLLRDPRNQIETLIGCASPQLRQLADRLRLPVAYAADAVDHLREHSASTIAAIWTSKALEPGRFWPLAISLSDIKASGKFLDELDSALDGPDLKHVVAACKEAQNFSLAIVPRYCYTPPVNQQGVLHWVPFHDTTIRAS
jgi:hypothetical protein